MRRVFAFLVGAVLVAGVVWSSVEHLLLDLRHEAARATVLGVQDGKWVGGVNVRFETRDGRTVGTTIDQVWLLRPPDYRSGQQVVVEYDPERPTRARITGSSTYASTVVLFGGLLAVVVTAEVVDRRRRRT